MSPDNEEIKLNLLFRMICIAIESRNQATEWSIIMPIDGIKPCIFILCSVFILGETA